MNVYKFSIPRLLNGVLWEFVDKHSSLLTMADRGLGTNDNYTVWEVVTTEDVYLKMLLTLPQVNQMGKNAYS